MYYAIYVISMDSLRYTWDPWSSEDSHTSLVPETILLTNRLNFSKSY